jgi:hypothetical protein
MHDGHTKTLKDAIDFPIGGGNSNVHLDNNIRVPDLLTAAGISGVLDWRNAA